MIERHPDSQAFHDTLEAMGALHDRKQRDYGLRDSPFANVIASEDYGIPGWVGCLVRANDKSRRLQTAVRQLMSDGQIQMANESVEDSLLDLAVYVVIALVLYQQEQEATCG